MLVAIIATLLWVRSEFFIESIVTFSQPPKAVPGQVNYFDLSVQSGRVFLESGRFEIPALTGIELNKWLKWRGSLPPGWKRQTIRNNDTDGLLVKLQGELTGFGYSRSTDQVPAVWSQKTITRQRTRVRFPIWALIAIGSLPWINSGIRILMRKTSQGNSKGTGVAL